METASLDGLAQRVALDAGLRLRRTFGAVAAGFRSHARLYAIAILTYGLAGLQGLWLGHRVDLKLVSLVTGTDADLPVPADLHLAGRRIPAPLVDRL
jgi:hypothetical protein